jgi:hypothetical protein
MMSQNYCVVYEKASQRFFLDAEALLPEKGIEVVQHIMADTWQEAREQVDTSNMWYSPGYGWMKS